MSGIEKAASDIHMPLVIYYLFAESTPENEVKARTMLGKWSRGMLVVGNQGNFGNSLYLGVNLGKYCLYDMALQYGK